MRGVSVPAAEPHAGQNAWPSVSMWPLAQTLGCASPDIGGFSVCSIRPTAFDRQEVPGCPIIPSGLFPHALKGVLHPSTFGPSGVHLASRRISHESHETSNETGRCLVCRLEFDQPPTGRPRRYCSDAHRSQAHYWRTRPRDQAFQSVIREQVPTLAGCYVEKITNADAKWLILRYEWLGTMPRRAYSYGLKTARGALLGVTVFGFTMSAESRDVCGKENRHLAICLERGACVPDAPANAASFLISSCREARRAEHGFRIFYGYADPEAGELARSTRALNWLRIADTRQSRTTSCPMVSLSERSLRHRQMTRQEALDAGAEIIVRPSKRKYVTFQGDKRERKALRAALRSVVQPY